MRLVATVLEDSLDSALETIRSLDRDHDMIELRAERFGEIDLAALRTATSRPIILTYRGTAAPAGALTRALEAGIDFVDVEWQPDLRIDLPRDRVVLSHHDFEGFPDPAPLLQSMREHGCAHVKIALTLRTLADNETLLGEIRPGTTVIGMGERGLYARLLAPFRGSELAFVAAGDAAAPGQLSLERALTIYGGRREELHAQHVFAIAGDPAGHSRSPDIHNPLFREKGIDAAYTIASFERFDEITEALLRGTLRGVSVTAPFKEEAFTWAQAHGAASANAVLAGSVNTITMRDGRATADNTDVDGFGVLADDAREEVPIRTAAIAGAGGTARAALAALRARGIDVRVFNRSSKPFPVPIEGLDRISECEVDLFVDTLPGGVVDIPLPARAEVSIEAAYPSRRAIGARRRFTGFDLLQAQAVRQNALFCEAAR